MRTAVKGRQALRFAELLVGVVSPQRRPVVVGAIVQILVLVRPQRIGDAEKLHRRERCLRFVDPPFLVHLGRSEGQVFRVEHGGRRHEHEAHLAGVTLAQGLHRRQILVPDPLFGGQNAVAPGKHPVLPPQQDAAALGLLEQGRLGQALQADPLVPPEDLILHIFGIVRKIVVQPIHRHGRQFGPLGEGSVFQLAVGAVRRHQVQHEQRREEQGESRQHRVLLQGGNTLFRIHALRPPQKLKYRNGLFVLPTT